MNRIFPAFFFILVLTATACQNSARNKVDGNLAEIKFKERDFDYGQILQGSSGVCTFEFTNSSKVPLVINQVKTSCGCTSPDWSRDPIEPGKKGMIRIKYNTNIRGTFRKTITVYSNASNSPVNLFINGEVITEKYAQ